MKIEHLDVLNFRNLRPQQVRFEKRITYIVGKNGQGKTSFIEAAFCLAHGKSFRTNSQSDLISRADLITQEELISNSESDFRESSSSKNPNKNLAVSRGVISSSSGKRVIELVIGPKKKSITVNGKTIDSANSFLGQFVSVVFTPDDLQLVKGTPSIRRRFFDRILVMVSQSYLSSFVMYQRALKNRNALLQTLKSSNSLAERNQLSSWNKILSQYGVQITKHRQNLIENLQPAFVRYYRELSGREISSERVKLHYSSSFVQFSTILDSQEAENLLNLETENDIRRGTTKLGCQRDTVEFSFSKSEAHQLESQSEEKFYPAKMAASQGQARSLALALTFASVDFLKNTLGEPPVVLLDDVQSELDSDRRLALGRILLELDSQVIVTATELASEFDREFSDADIRTVSEGSISGSKPSQKML